MRVLFPTVDRSVRVATHFDQFKKAFATTCKVDFINTVIPNGWKTGNYATQVMRGRIKPVRVLEDYLNKKEYDFILTDADFIYVHENWKDIDIPKAMIIEDCQKGRNPELQMKWAVKNKFDIIFYKYKKTFEKNYGDIGVKSIVWMPHSVDVKLFKDYGLSKKHKVLMVGQCYGNAYPHRTKMYEMLNNRPYFTKIGRPMECNQGENKPRWPVGKDYAMELNQAEICVTGGSAFNFPVMKYFEIPASKSIVMTNWFSELGELGFVDDRNIVIADFENLHEQVVKLLGNKKKLKEIQNNGHDFIRKYHTTHVRALEMKKEMEKWLRKT